MMNQKRKKITIYCRGRAPLTKNLMRELKQTTTLAKSGGPSRAFLRSSTSSRLLNNSHHHTVGWSRATTRTMHQARVILSVSSIGSLNSATCQVRQLLRYPPILGSFLKQEHLHNNARRPECWCFTWIAYPHGFTKSTL